MFRFEGITFQPESGALSKGSETVVLRAKTAEVLHFLLRSPNELVTKDRLLDELWPDCHVGSGSLVQSIQELRKVLGDDAKNPRFIQTMPRRGYRWIAPLAENPSPEAGACSAESRATASNPDGMPVKTGARPWRTALAGLVLGLLTVSIWLWQRPFPPALQVSSEIENDPVRVLMLPIVDETSNSTGEWMGSGIRDMVTDHLAGVPTVKLLSAVTTFQALSKHGLPMPLARSEAERLMLNTDAGVLIQSRIVPKENGWLFRYSLFRRGAAVEEGVLHFTDPLRLSRQLAGLLAHSPQSPGGQGSFSGNAEANSDYLRGKRALEMQSAPLAKRYFEAALLLDPDFQACRLQLARACYLMGDMDKSASLYAQVLDISGHLGQRGHQVQALQGLAAVDWRKGRLQQSISRLFRALDQSRKLGRKDLEARSLRVLAWHHNHLGYWKKHDEFERRAQALFEAIDDEEQVADALYYLGASQSPVQDDGRNRLLLQMALNYYRNTQNPYDLAYANLAMAFNRETPNAEKLACLQKAESLFEKLGYRLVLPSVWEGIGLALAQSSDPEGFKTCLLKANRVYEELGARGDQANTEFLLGAAEIMIGLSESGPASIANLDDGLAWLDRCDPFNREHQVIGRQASSALLRGMVALEKDQVELATGCFKKAMGLFQALDLQEGIAVSAVAIATLHLQLGQWRQALDWLKTTNESYPGRPGLWQPFAIYAHLKLGELDKASGIARAHAESAREGEKQEAERWLALCETLRSGVGSDVPAPPSLLAVYFQSF